MKNGQQPQLAGEELRSFWDGWLNSNQMKQISMEAIGRGDHVLRTLRSLAIRDANILEIGCANGWFSQNLAEFGNVTGADISTAGIEAARKLLPEAEFIAGDFLEMDLGEGAYDVVVCMECIAYMSNQAQFVSNVARNLRPHAYFIVTTPNWPFWQSQGKGRKSPGTLAAKHLSMSEFLPLVRSHLEIVTATTILPTGHKGICRVTNSVKLNNALQAVFSPETIKRAKGRLGLGQTLYVVARKQ